MSTIRQVITIRRASHVVRSAPRKIKASDVKHAIKHAQNLCLNFESTPACRSAWDAVEEISAALDAQESRPKPEPDRTELAKREYDI
jgi:hypothetical protein